MGGYKLFLVQTRPTTLDAVELIVHFVRSVKGNVHEGIFGERVERDVFQSRFDDRPAGLIAGGNKVNLGDAVVLEGLYGFNDVNNRTARTDANISRRGIEMVGHRADGGIAFGSFNICHWIDHFGERGVEKNGTDECRRKLESTMAGRRSRTSASGKSAEARGINQ